MEEMWRASRSGSHAGRGFHYQDAVATEFAVRAWSGDLVARRIVPEGLDDVSLELEAGWLHLQVKSRREHRGRFTLAELASAWTQMSQRLSADPGSRAALVLEQPLDGAEIDSDHPLSSSADAKLRESIAEAIDRAGVDLDDFLERTHVLVKPAPAAEALSLLSSRLDLPLSTCAAHLGILQSALTALADVNGERQFSDMAAMSVPDIGRVIDDVSEAVDPSALEYAVREGLCELVDFATPLRDAAFFRGVDVKIGHVVAGLPTQRTALVDALVDGLTQHGVGMVIGPSGSGKSALLWMAAHGTRHHVRWYRVRRVNIEDVAALARLVKGQRPGEATPVGLVIDDLGREGRGGFDPLLDELAEMPGVVVLGACREEDLVLVRSAQRAAQVRPTLDEELAAELWRHLHDRSETSWSEWREPYEQANGLLLEYGHLLTAGERLADTVKAQVADRLREERTLELETLALVTTADTFGADVDAHRLSARLGTESMRLRGALERLVDEHLVVEQEGRLGGLHELRSEAAMRALHRIPPPTLTQTARRLVVDLLDPDGLQVFVIRVLEAGVVTDDAMIDALATRLADEEPRVLSAALHALRVVSFRRSAAQWRTVLDEEGISPTSIELVSHHVLHGGDMDLLPEAMCRAVSRIRALEAKDLRSALLAQIGSRLSTTLASADDITTVAGVLAVLGEMDDDLAIDPTRLRAALSETPELHDLELLLRTASTVSEQLAKDLADAFGEPSALVARLQRERPWVRNARLSMTDDERPAVEADYVAVASGIDAHEAVVALARTLAALVPRAEVISCRAIDASGELAGIDMPIADKMIDRRRLPGTATVAWNRARGRMATSAVAASTETEHQLAARAIVSAANGLLERVGDRWVAGRGFPPALDEEARSLASAAEALRPPPLSFETVSPLNPGDAPDVAAISFLGTGIAANLLPRLVSGQNVAPMIQLLAVRVTELERLERWRLLDDPPIAEVTALRRRLEDLYAVVSERATKGTTFEVAVRQHRRITLEQAASLARRRARTRMDDRCRKVEQELAKAGYQAHVVRRLVPLDGIHWPAEDVLVLVEADDMLDWIANLDALGIQCQTLLKDRAPFWLAPVRAGEVIASYGCTIIESIFPDTSVSDWPELPVPVLDQVLGDLFADAVGALSDASGIIGVRPEGETHRDEESALAEALDRFEAASTALGELAERAADPLVDLVREFVDDFIIRLQQQAEGNSEGHTIVTGILAGVRGEPNDVFNIIIFANAACAEWDAEPHDAWDRVQRWMAHQTPP